MKIESIIIQKKIGANNQSITLICEPKYVIFSCDKILIMKTDKTYHSSSTTSNNQTSHNHATAFCIDDEVKVRIVFDACERTEMVNLGRENDVYTVNSHKYHTLAEAYEEIQQILLKLDFPDHTYTELELIIQNLKNNLLFFF